MNNEQILKQAIEKAYPDTKHQEKGDLLEYAKGQIKRDGAYRLIFSHDFAKAFWGKRIMGTVGPPEWSYHLQQLVLEHEPLKYLKKFLDTEG